MLTLYDELYLLSVHEDKGTYLKSTVESMKPGLAGALLAELALMGKIQTNEKHRLILVDKSPTEDNLLNEVLNILEDSEKDHKFGYWINKVSNGLEKLSKQMTERLIQMGIVSQEDDHLEWEVPTPLDTQVNATSKYWVRRRLRGIVLAQEEADQRDIAILSLLRACGFLDLIFLKDERRYASRHINELVISFAMKDSAAQTIEEIETAIAIVVEDD